METTIIQVTCEKCKETFTVHTENTPYQTKLEPTADLKIVETRTYLVPCPHCGETNQVMQPTTKSLLDLEQLGDVKGNVKTINVKGGPACLMMSGILIGILALLVVVGYFLVKGIGMVFSWL